jgi:hypothetical protein
MGNVWLESIEGGKKHARTDRHPVQRDLPTVDLRRSAGIPPADYELLV